MAWKPQVEAQTDMPQSARKRPFLVTFMSLFLWIMAILVVVANILQFGFGVFDKKTPVNDAVVYTVLSVLGAIAGIGLWRMKKWGVVLYALSWSSIDVYRDIANGRDLILVDVFCGSAILLSAMLWWNIVRSDYLQQELKQDNTNEH